MKSDTESTKLSTEQNMLPFTSNHYIVSKILKYVLRLFTSLVITFLWVPLLLIIFLSFAESSATLFPINGVTLAHYQELFQRSSLLHSGLRSAVIATTSATIATIFGVLAAFGLVRFDFRFKNLFRVFCILPLLIPGVILGIELLIYFTSLLGLQTGFLTIVLTHSVYGIPFVVLPVTVRLFTFDQSLEESARDLGADAVEAFWDVTLPIIMPAVAAGYLFAWIRSFEDFIRVFFVGGATDVLTIEMYGLIKFGLGVILNPLASLIVFVIAILLLVAVNMGNVAKYVTN